MCNVTIQKGFILSFHALADVSTIFRIAYRYKKRRLWWDDYSAAVALLGDLVYAIAWSFKSTNLHQAISWICVEIPAYPVVIWAARLSIGLSIKRFCALTLRSHRAFHLMNAFFLAMGVINLIQRIVICIPKSAWGMTGPIVYCSIGQAGGIVVIVTDVISDILLVFVPVFLLWRVQLPPNQRRLVLSIFAASALSSIPSIAYMTLQAVERTFTVICTIPVVIHIKAAVTLMVCNLLVIVTCTYRLLFKECDYRKARFSDIVQERSGSYSSSGIDSAEKSHITLTELSGRTPQFSTMNSQTDPRTTYTTTHTTGAYVSTDIYQSTNCSSVHYPSTVISSNPETSFSIVQVRDDGVGR